MKYRHQAKLALCALFLLAFSSCATSTGTTSEKTVPPPKASTSQSAESDGPASDSLDMPESSQTLVAKNSAEYDTDFYLGETVFIGDSRTYGFITYNCFPPEQVYAINGSTQETIQDRVFVQLDPLSDTKYTVAEAVGIRKPDRIMVCFGINGISLMNETEFMLEYRKLVDSLSLASPESIIIIQSILPVSWWKYQEMPDFDNEKIDHFNSLLYKYASENGYYYLNSAEAMKDEKNSLNPIYDAGDGLHFNAKAYTALMDYYKTHLVLKPLA